MPRFFSHYALPIFAQKAAMAADTIQAYLEHGTIQNSVNFPAAALPERKEGSIRVCVATQNIPGMLAYISEVFAKHGSNILQQINTSRGDIAYNVVAVARLVQRLPKVAFQEWTGK